MARKLKERHEERERITEILTALGAEPEGGALEAAKKRLPHHSPEDQARLAVCATALDELCQENEDGPDIREILKILSPQQDPPAQIDGFEQVLMELAGARASVEGVLYSEAVDEHDMLRRCSEKAKKFSEAFEGHEALLGAALTLGDEREPPTNIDDLFEIRDLEKLTTLGKNFRTTVGAVAGDLELAASLFWPASSEAAWGDPLILREDPSKTPLDGPQEDPPTGGRLYLKNRGRPRLAGIIAADLYEYLRPRVESAQAPAEDAVVSSDAQRRNENALKLAAEILNKVLGDTPALAKPLSAQQVRDTHKSRYSR